MYRIRRGELRCPSRSRVKVLSYRSTPCPHCCHLVHLTDTGVFGYGKGQRTCCRSNFSLKLEFPVQPIPLHSSKLSHTVFLSAFFLQVHM